MATSTTTPTNTPKTPAQATIFTYDESETKIYISTATIELKAKEYDQLAEFEWHTNVLTPAASPIVEPEVAPMQVQQTEASSGVTEQVPEKQHNNQRFTPAYTYEESDDIYTMLSKFMSSERYNSGLSRHTLVN